MEDFVLAQDPTDLWLAESAEVTVAGVCDAANEFVEQAAEFLLAWWRYADKWRRLFPPPPGRCWEPERAFGPSFAGVAPAATPFVPATGLGSPTLTRRLALAQSLRTGGAPLPGATPGRRP
jgi:hypothetical protein